MDIKACENCPIVLVRWEDIRSEHGWTDSFATTTIPCVTVGFLIADTPDGITVLSDYMKYEKTESWYGCSTYIPRSNVMSIDRLKYDETTYDSNRYSGG